MGTTATRKPVKAPRKNRSVKALPPAKVKRPQPTAAKQVISYRRLDSKTVEVSVGGLLRGRVVTQAADLFYWRSQTADYLPGPLTHNTTHSAKEAFLMLGAPDVPPDWEEYNACKPKCAIKSVS